MAYASPSAWYLSDNQPTATTGWSAVSAWSASAVTTVGTLRRQTIAAFSVVAGATTTTLTVASVNSGIVVPGTTLLTGASAGSTITAYGTGTGGIGTYTIAPSQTITGGTTVTGALTVGGERVFVCVVAGTTGTFEPNWILTKGGSTTDNTVTWREVTGQPGLNGDISANCPVWTISSTPALGFVIYDVTSASLQICTVSAAGAGSKPTFSATAGTITSDGATAKWTSLGLASGFAGWSAPFARGASAIATNWAVAGNTIFTADNHAETQASAITWSPGTQALPMYFYCVDHTASVPPGSGNLKTTATVSTTGANSINLTNSSAANLYCYGITFQAGSGSSTAGVGVGATGQAFNCVLEACGLTLNNTSASSTLGLATNNQVRGCYISLRNTIMTFGAVGQSVVITGSVVQWKNTLSAIAGSVPTTLFGAAANGAGNLLCEGVDLSAAGTGKTLVGSGLQGLIVKFVDCKLGASVTVAATPAMRGEVTDVISSDSSGTNYNNQRYTYEGTLIPSTTIVRTGGAVIGTTALSWNIATTANVVFLEPFEAPSTWINNTTTGSPVAVKLYGIWFGTALPNNDQVWHDVEYYSSASSPIASLGSGTKANGLASGSAWAADTSAWDTAATAWSSAQTWSVGQIRSASSNPGRLFICTTGGAGTVGTIPAGFGTAVDGTTGITDNVARWSAGWRFVMSVSVTPQLAGYIHTYVKAALASTTFYVDPQIVLA